MHVAIVGASLLANETLPMLRKRFADKSAPTKTQPGLAEGVIRVSKA